MKRSLLAAAVLLIFMSLSGEPANVPSAGAMSNGDNFSAMAYLPTGAGPAMRRAGATASLTISLERYTTDEEAKQYAATLLEKGPDELLKALAHAPAIGKVTMQRRLGFFDLKLVRSHATNEGRRIVGVCDRPIGFLEAYFSGRSLDNKFGIVIMDLKTNNKGKEDGSGVLIYAAKVTVLEGNKVEGENYGIDPVRLMGVRKF